MEVSNSPGVVRAQLTHARDGHIALVLPDGTGVALVHTDYLEAIVAHHNQMVDLRKGEEHGVASG